MSAHSEGDGVLEPEAKPQEPAHCSVHVETLQSQGVVLGGRVAGGVLEGEGGIETALLRLFAWLVEEKAQFVARVLGLRVGKEEVAVGGPYQY